MDRDESRVPIVDSSKLDEVVATTGLLQTLDSSTQEVESIEYSAQYS